MRVAAEAFHFEIPVPSIERVTERGQWLRRSPKAKHALAPGLAGELIGLLTCLGCQLRRCADRTAVDGFS